MNVVMNFGMKGNLRPLYIGPYQISKWIDNVAYRFELQQEIAAIFSFPCLRSAWGILH